MLTLAYTRVSTNRQDLSTEAQYEQVRRSAAYFQLAEPEVYADADTSGSIPFAEREQGAELLERIREFKQSSPSPPGGEGRGEVPTITLLVPKVDRLGRDSIDVNQTVRLLDSLGVRVIFLDINVDTRTAMGRAFMQIAAVFAELELARIRERIQTALDLKKSKGELCGSIPFGWDAIETGEVTAKGVKVRKLVDNPSEQAWLLRMVEWRRAGFSYGYIAKQLNAANVPTKRAALLRQQAGIRNQESADPASCPLSPDPSLLRWQQGNVKNVLTNATVAAWLQLQHNTAAA